MNFSIRNLLIATLFGIVMSATAHAGRLIAVEDSTSDFYEIDSTVPSSTFLGNGITGLSLSGLAYDSVNGVMYVSDTCGPACFGLGTVDLTTWEVTEIGGFVSTSNIHALAYDSTRDMLFGWDLDKNDILVSLNRATGEETAIGSPGGPTIVAMTYDAATDTMYGADRDSDSLYTIDPVTGDTTLVGAFVLGIASSQMGIDFDAETGRLYLGDQNGDFYEINTTTGEATLLGNLGFTIDGLASISAAEPATPVPTMSSLGLLLMVMLFAAIAWRRVRVGA